MARFEVGVQLHPQATTVDALRGRVAGRRRARRRQHLGLGPLLPALRRPRRRALRGLHAARGARRRDEQRAPRRAGHVQLVPQPEPARRHGPHDRPHQPRPLHPRHRIGLVRARLHGVRIRVRHRARAGCAGSQQSLPGDHGTARSPEPAADRRRADPDRRQRREGDAAARRASTPTDGTRFGPPENFAAKNRVLDEWCRQPRPQSRADRTDGRHRRRTRSTTGRPTSTPVRRTSS